MQGDPKTQVIYTAHPYGQPPSGVVGSYDNSIEDSRMMPVQVVNEQPSNRISQRASAGGASSADERIPRPNIGTWGSGICDWSANLYPSCYCSCCCMHGMYIMGQMSEKHKFQKFNTAISMYILMWIIAIILELRSHRKNLAFVFWIPCIFSIAFSVALRLHMSRKFSIRTEGTSSFAMHFYECLVGLVCCPCSTSQMARYTYGYVRVLDGDARLDREDSYLV